MDAIRQYILSIICAALICSIVSDLSGKTSFQKPIKLVCSIFFAYVMLGPLVNFNLPEPVQSEKYLAAAREAASQGENIRIRSMSAIIKQEAEAYILKEAEAIGADITAEIELDSADPPTPVGVTIRGSFDATCEIRLSGTISETLGIPKEHQTWIRQDLNG